MKLEYKYYPNVPYLEQQDAVGYGRVDFLPGDSSIVISNGVYISHTQRNKGIGQKQHAERLRLLKEEHGIHHVICTVANDNLNQIHLLGKFGWEKIYDFGYNSMWVKDLRDKPQDFEDVE